jgi:pimeloyl-ACP methyl ester carboxylesterase
LAVEYGFAHNGHASLYYEISGEGQPVVLIHAGVADSRQWNNEFVDLARDHRVLRYDMRGYGKSLPVEGPFSHMRDLLTLLDQVAIREPAVLIGCSMGGGLAMDFALAFPDRVNALVMVGSAPVGLHLDAPDHPAEAEALAASEMGDWDRVAELEAQIWFDGMGRTPEQVNQPMRRLALEMNRLALDHAATQLGTHVRDADTRALERLGELNIPVLVIVGKHDIHYLQAAADYMLEHLPQATKVVLADAAHLPNMDHPVPFQRAVRTFLQENRL